MDAGVSGFGIDPFNGDVLYADLQSGNNSVIKRIISANPIPYINAMELSGTNLIVSGSNGAPNGNYYLLAATNVAQPLENWTMLATNAFDGSSNFRFTNGVEQSHSQRFYILLLP